MSKVPALTPLQFLILGELLGTDRPGRELRETLARHGVKRSGPAFYQLMARLERERLVTGRYEQVTAAGQIVTERHYHLTREGERRWDQARTFFQRVSEAHGRPRWSDA